MVTVSRHLGLMWVGVEATTLASAPLIYFHRHHRSLEATWKYLLICSVGIALALLGNFFVAVAARSAGGPTIHLTIDDLVAHAGSLNPLWLKAAFLFFLVGYGTKMGLAPLHTWLPDAHSEAPSVVSALLSGALLNCAFLTILRTHSLLSAAGLAAFSSDLLVLFGLISMAVAAVFILGQADFKRMLAYSSVEHMGILALGIGIGGVATFGAMLHAVNHSLTKAMLFLAAGNILALYRTKSTTRVRGVLRTLPITGVLWLAGFLAIVGSPPFGPFLSELTILKGVLDAGRPVVAVAYLLALAIVFVGMATIFLRMAYGPPPGVAGDGGRLAGRCRRIGRATRAAVVDRAGDGAGACGLDAGSLRAAATHGSAAPGGRRVGSQLMSIARSLDRPQRPRLSPGRLPRVADRAVPSGSRRRRCGRGTARGVVRLSGRVGRIAAIGRAGPGRPRRPGGRLGRRGPRSMPRSRPTVRKPTCSNAKSSSNGTFGRVGHPWLKPVRFPAARQTCGVDRLLPDGGRGGP